MKSFFGGALAIVVFGYFGVIISWWGIIFVAIIVGAITQEQGGLSFFSGLLGGGIFYALYATILDNNNESQLSTMMAEVLNFNPFWPTVLIGAVLAALGMLIGKYGRDSLFGEKKIIRYRGRLKTKKT